MNSVAKRLTEVAEAADPFASFVHALFRQGAKELRYLERERSRITAQSSFAI